MLHTSNIRRKAKKNNELNRKNVCLAALNQLNEGAISFEEASWQIFKYQSENCLVYNKYLNHLGWTQTNSSSIEEIPFLPIELFKNETVKTGCWQAQTLFKSSGTTGQIRSTHHIRDIEHYHKVARLGFEQFYGHDIEDAYFLALLPGYLENEHSSLISMAKYFMDISDSNLDGFYAHREAELLDRLSDLKRGNKPIYLFGVSFALMDLAEQYDFDYNGITVIETGGMKGRRRDLTKMEVASRLQMGMSGATIHSEYGMTELQSQAYSATDMIYQPSRYMKVIAKEINDPLAVQRAAKVGQLNIIDLANIDSCAFIQTSDIGIVFPNGKFTVQGRLSSSDLRGCNLLLEA